MSKIKKPLALLLSLLMLMTALPFAAIPASAATASQLDGVLSHLPNERNAHYYKDSTEAAILAAREAAETALETGEGISAAYNLCLNAFDEAWACDEVAYNEYGDTVFVFVNRDESKAHATLYLDTDASASLKPGDTFDVTFSIKADFPLRQFRVAFAYDKAVFEADGSSITYADGITDLLDVNSYPLYTEYGYFNGTLNKTRQFYPVEWDQDMISKYNFVAKEFGRNTEKDADYMLPTEKTEIFTVTMKVKDDAGLVGKTGEIFLCNEMLSTMENDYLFDGVPALPIKIYRGFSTNPYEEVADDEINIRQACKVMDEAAGVGQTITWDGTALKTYSIVGEGEEPGVDLSVLSTGAKIQLGTQSGSPVEWVIGGDGSTGMSVPEGCIALVSSGLVASDTAFEQTGYSNIYATSNLRSVVENAVSFIDDEKSIIQSRTLGSPDIAGDPVTADVWAPTLADATGLSDAGLSGTGSFYWLCSPGNADYLAANVYPDGGVEPYGVDTYDPEGVRAGLYLDLSKITKLTLVEGTTDTYIVNAPEEEPGVDLSKLSTGKKIIYGTATYGSNNGKALEWVVAGDGKTGMEVPEGCIALALTNNVMKEYLFDNQDPIDNHYSTSNLTDIFNTGIALTKTQESAIKSRTLEGGKTAGDNCDGVAGDSVTVNFWAPTVKDANALKEVGLSATGWEYTLSSPGSYGTNYVACVSSNGNISVGGTEVNIWNFFRPAFYLDLSKIEAINEVEDAENTYTLDIMHTHAFSEEWSTDENVHWHECTAEECDIEDYSTCGIDEVAYGEHVGMEDDYTCDTCGYVNAEGQLVNAVTEAKAALNTAKTNAKSDEAKAILDGAITALDEAESLDDVNTIKSDALENAEGADNALAEAIATAKSGLETAKNNAKSDAAKAVISDAIAELADATNLPAVENIVDKANNDAAEHDKELAEVKATAKEALNTALTNAKSDAAKAALNDAIATVDNATDPDTVAEAKTTGTINAAIADNALADAQAEAKKALETAKAEATSKEAKAAIDKAIANVEKATNPVDVASAKSAGITAAANADKTLADTISNFKNTLETAKNDAKSDAAKAVYADAIAALDNAKSLEDVETIVESAEMNAANADKALADAKTDAKKELETAKTNAVSDAAKAALDEAIANVEKATSPAGVASAKSAGTTDAAAADKALADAKAEAKKALEAAKEKAVSDEAKAALDEAIADVEKATNPTDVAAAKTSGLENAADADEALAEAIENAKADLAEAEENAVADDAKAALSAAAEDMDNATSLAAVADKKAAAEEAAQIAEKELADAKAAAIEAVEALAGDDATDEVKQLVEDAKEAINAATSPEAVDTAEDNGLAAVEHKQKEEGFTVPDLDIQLGYRETAPVNAESTTNKIIYTSSNEKVVTVDEDGNLKAVGKGKATITATLEGTDISEEIEIEVSYTFWEGLVWHIRNLLELIASGFKWLLGLIGINL